LVRKLRRTNRRSTQAHDLAANAENAAKSRNIHHLDVTGLGCSCPRPARSGLDNWTTRKP
jgi:hypothetical protein